MSKPLALVTGGSRGIGRAIVGELAKTHQVVATYNNNREAAERVASETGCETVQCQLHDLESCFQLAAQFQEIELLVNNAGMAPRQRMDILEATPESFDELLATNLRGPYFLTQRVARSMVERRRGRIVFVTSISSFAASVNRGEYCISKAGLSMAAKLYAARLAPHDVGVFEIQPGIIRTDMTAAVASAYEEKISNGLLPQRRMGEPQDVAQVVRGIADGLLDYCAGQVLHADGGFHLRVL